MSEFLLVGLVSFVGGWIVGVWVMVKAARYVRQHHLVIEDLAVVYDIQRRPFAQLCVNITSQHVHTRIRIHPELAEALIAGMDKAEHANADIHGHTMRGKPN